DVFIAGAGDTITDFDAQTGITGNGMVGGSSRNNDFVDLTGVYNKTTLAAWNAANPGNTYETPMDWLRADQADGLLNQAGGLRLQNAGVKVAAQLLNTENTGVVCFARDTMIQTALGERPVQSLSPGDLVMTEDHGPRPIRWIGRRRVAAEGRFAPIRFCAGVLGNRRDLLVSPQHRMLLQGWQAELHFGEPAVLVAAKSLVNDQTIRPQEGGWVEYFHLLFDDHEIIFAEGCATESFHPGAQAWRSLDADAREEILSLFPELHSRGLPQIGSTARLTLEGREGRLAAQFLAA
ncbi:MAG: hypothetical protein EBU97_04790, partial [Rhodobacteraceae bacterium]|nr:hypothetical protein [Paracoccaceae bacterium]